MTHCKIRPVSFPLYFFNLREFSFAFSSSLSGHVSVKTREILEPVLDVGLRPQIEPTTPEGSRLACSKLLRAWLELETWVAD